MEKSITARRKAQRLARDGHLEQACEEMRRVLAESEPDPYDHVYLGDLLDRLGGRDEALSAYEEAVRSYQRVGLHRNAIAVCKKILRLDDSRATVLRVIGDLYLREGLQTEAAPYMLGYLDSFSVSGPAPDPFLQTLDAVAGIPGLRVDLAVRVGEQFIRAGLKERAAAFWQEAAEQMDVAGASDPAQDLLERARRAMWERAREGPAETVSGEDAPCPAAVQQGAEAGPAGEGGPGSVLPEQPLLAPAETEQGLAPPETLSHGEGRGALLRIERFPVPGTQEPTGSVTEQSSPWNQTESVGAVELPTEADRGEAEVRQGAIEAAPPAEPSQGLRAASAQSGAEGLPVETEASETAPNEGTEEAAASSSESSETTDGAIPSEVLPPDLEPLQSPEADAGLHHASLLEEAGLAARDGRWAEARSLYEQVHRERPLDRGILDHLLHAARQMEDREGEALYLSLLGDSWIEEGELEEALALFLQVLRIDPDNGTAQRRLARFREMGLPVAEPGNEPEQRPPDSILGVLRGGQAQVAVRRDAAASEDGEWVDLGALLEEFKSGLKSEMDSADYQSHYDLALSHQSMGLPEEALDELDQVLGIHDLPSNLELSAREMKGSCLMELQRAREAIHEFREALGQADGDRRWTILYHLGRALEAAEEWQEAESAFDQVVRGGQGFLDAQARLEYCREQAGGTTPSAEAEAA